MATWDTKILEPVWADRNNHRSGGDSTYAPVVERTAAPAPAPAAAAAPEPNRPKVALTDRAVEFIAAFAGKAQLKVTADQQPHIINDLGPYRRNPAKCLEIIDDFLAIDARSHERFSFAVLNELQNLQIYLRKRLGEMIRP